MKGSRPRTTAVALPGGMPGGSPPGPGPDWPAGRAVQLSQARTLLREAVRGEGRVLVVAGGPGSGRSALLDAIGRVAADRGVPVLRSHCSADETDRGHAGAQQLFLRAGRDLPEPPPGDEERFLWQRLQEHVADGPVVLTVDDVQFADAPSRRWLLQVARRADRMPLLLVVSECRPHGPTGPRSRFGRTLPPSLVHTCDVPPLGPAAVGELLARHSGRPVPPSVVADWARATCGVPALLTALLADLAHTGERPEHPAREPVPAHAPTEGFVEAVEQWLHGMGREAMAAAYALARLDGSPAGPDGAGDLAALLGALCGTEPERAAAWLRELTGLGVLCPPAPDAWPAFAHPLLCRAVSAAHSPFGAREVRRTAADVLHRRGAPDAVVAAHLVAAGGEGPGWAAETLLCAARAARGAGHVEQAVAFLRRALAEPLPPGRRGTVLTELGGLEVVLGPAERASGVRHLAESVRLAQSDAGVFKAANALGAALAARGETTAALEVMEELTERYVSHPEMARAVQAAAALIASHDGRSWQEVVERLRRLTARTPARPAPAARALVAEYDSTSGALSAAEAAAIAREVTAEPLDPLSRMYVLASAATLAQWADELTLADELVGKGVAAHRGTTVDPGHQCLLSVRAESLMMRGRYGELLAACTEWGVPLGPSTVAEHVGPVNAHLVAQAVLALTDTGRVAEARRLVRSVAPDGCEGSWEWNEFLYARGLLHLAEGDPAAALADLLECGRRQAERRVVSPVVTPWRSAAADCRLLLGHPGEAVDLAAEELELARRWGTPRTVGRALRALGAATGGRSGMETAAQAVDLLRAADIGTELVPALIAQGRMLAEAGRRADARRVLREAVEHAERTGAGRLRDVAAGLLAAAGARLPSAPQTGAAALTGSERRICGLAAQGHTNAEIAALLHLAVRTVETHLTHSFRKLGVRRRAEIADRLGAPLP